MDIIHPTAITIISVFCLQAILFASVLLLKKKQTQADKYLSLVLLFFVMASFNVALFYFLKLIQREDLIKYFQIELLFGLGPSLYLYTRSVSDAKYKFNRNVYLMFLPVLLEFVYYRTELYKNGAISIYEAPKNISNIIYMMMQWGGVVWTSIFIILSIRVLNNYEVWLRNNYSNVFRKSLSWLSKPVILYALFWFIWLAIRLADLFLFNEAFNVYYFYPMFIILSAITCWIGFQGYVKNQIDISGFSKSNKASSPKMEVDIELIHQTVKKIKELLELEKLYLDPNLKLQTLSDKLGIHSKKLSIIINRGMKMNFYELVNNYRVEEFIKRIKGEDHNKLTLLGHSLESGFGSKSTFNHIFKKHTQMTPREFYQKTHQKSSIKKSE